MKSRTMSLAAAAVFVLLAIYELVHLLRGEPWRGYGPSANWLALLLVPIWLAAAFSLVISRYRAAVPVVAAVGVLVAATHFAMLRIGMNAEGYVYFAGTALAAIFMGLRYALLRREHSVVEERMPDERRKVA